jgi:DNA helicase-2/ATP-dependent DNA helicase PcrA
MNLLIQKQESLVQLKKELSIKQKKILDIEMNIMTLEKDIVEIVESNTSNILVENMSLSSQQKEIVESDAHNILVVACPGSGKTHTVIARYVNLVINKKVDPASIILITFTKKAGMEMNNRIQSILPHKLPYYVGSLHGLGYRLLQQFNTTPNGINNTVLNETEYKQCIKECALSVMEESALTPDEQNMIKNQMPYIYDKISTDYPLDINQTLQNLSISTKYKKVITEILKNYKTMKKDQHLVDFNDLMIQFCALLGTKKINQFLEGVKYVFFDEYQDINPVQNYILKCFSKYSNIMAVGDDAQAIYAFRGSSIKYIWDFKNQFTDTTTYYLETNYRSTPSVVNFFQEIISHNTKQFKKEVVSNMVNPGLKPHIICHVNPSEQYKWIAEDIMKKKDEGVKLKDMVVLSRTNQSIERIEYELMKKNIPIIKSIGISLLNKNHVKDLIAFLIITVNTKSIIHWKRIISCHKGIGITKANSIIESTVPFDGMIALTTQDNDCLSCLYNLLATINLLKPKEQIHTIVQYLIKLWKENKEKNMDCRINDINNLITYMGNDSIDVFISNLHLNIEIECMDDSLFLSTAHSAKGLEWEYVYIIDMNNKDFPSMKHCFYKNEIDCCEEERRLFYVASSRAKKYLTISMHHDCNITISPFIKELNRTLYLPSNLVAAMDYKYTFTGYISKDVSNYLSYNGYEKIINLVNGIPHTRSNIFNKTVLTSLPAPTILPHREIVGTMMDLLVAKMLQVNFPDIIKGFNCSDKIPASIYHNYIDRLSDWRNILKDIFFMATYKHSSIDIVEQWKSYLLNDEAMKYYSNLEKMIVRYIESMKPTAIYVHMNVSCEPIRGEIDILLKVNSNLDPNLDTNLGTSIGPYNVLIEMKTTPDEACTFPNICQTIMYGYLLKKKQYDVNQIIILNLWDGTLDSLDMNEFNTIQSYNKIKKILYSA